MDITQVTIDTVFQLSIAILLSIFFWLLTRVVVAVQRKEPEGYLQWVGFTPIGAASLRLTLLVMSFLLVLSVFTSVLGPLRDISSAPGTVIYQVQQLGIAPETFVIIFIIAVFKTGLSEEIVFRGIIAKRLINWFGFQVGNLVQALIFMAAHIPLLFLAGPTELHAGIVALLVTRMTLSGWLLGWLCHRSGGSILPCWILHSSMNAIFYPILAFTPAVL
ncbi:MAG: type II CAAX endopeptidase family protein [Pseudomonadota bacterium]